MSSVDHKRNVNQRVQSALDKTIIAEVNFANNPVDIKVFEHTEEELTESQEEVSNYGVDEDKTHSDAGNESDRDSDILNDDKWDTDIEEEKGNKFYTIYYFTIPTTI